MIRKTIAVIALVFLMEAPLIWTVDASALKPEKNDKCPVCGMFVHKYPDWVSQLFFSDGGTFYFDGVKDMLKYIFNLEKYNPEIHEDQIRTIRVTDYYDIVAIDGKSAFYVVGSDVHGPMGRELIPFASAEAAAEFRRDHGGTGVLTFDQITPDVIQRLD